MVQRSKLTSKKIRALTPSSKRYTVNDGFGLALRVQPTGTKSWVLRLSFNGRVSDKILGHFPDLTLAQARQKARQIKQELGQDAPNGYTFRDAFILWCNLKRNRITSYKDERRRIERHILPLIGNRQIDEITAPLIINTVKPIERAKKQATLKRILMRTREILDLAVCAGYIQHNPIARVSKVFAPPRVKPMPSLHWSELPHAFAVMQSAPPRTQLLFLWACVTLLRPGECVKVRWDWIDGNTLTIPASEMKKGREHRVPLDPLAIDILALAKTLSPHPKSSYIWAGRSTGSHMSEQTISKFLHTSPLSGRLVAHGIRSIGRSWLADHEAPFEVAESCLSHVSGSAVSRAYQRSDYLTLRRHWMSLWNSYVLDCARKAQFLPSLPSLSKDPANC